MYNQSNNQLGLNISRVSTFILGLMFAMSLFGLVQFFSVILYLNQNQTKFGRFLKGDLWQILRELFTCPCPCSLPLSIIF